ncbi:hypothetical protein HNO88_003059 [Novosphingobium chloroacetimidivorans]|uniref:Reverse transcriptase domain-containing protein n=1 Tax=Novosphingobium chloroacetimidivorans TaxID=1428314 RepID=A0A7W7NXZ4_9SPHN|nr:reverse transcriptase domain-containing protein [Novosphingobium chloroacetimidivorans]MBB4859730.1 hypothetical protein [Novosphingobium chloroacetimidivorans]
MSQYSSFMRKHGNLRKAWQTIKNNGRRSSSPYVRDDIDAFASVEQANIRSLSAKLQHGSFKFSPAKGVALEKPNKPGSIRPIVIPRAADRVVQRCILDALLTNPAIRAKAFQPLSFGGVPKQERNERAGVPAAIEALLRLISEGGTHVIVGDIASFFTRIKKSEAVDNLAALIPNDPGFLDLFKDAIAVDIANHETIWRHKAFFPYGDLGVGQGVCLSPFLGNLVLADFDAAMNMGDCACIRYVDDILIIGPSGRAVSAQYRKAVRLLGVKGMEFAADKTDHVPRPIDQTFSYLGIEFSKGRMRPDARSRTSIVDRAKEVAGRSLIEIRSAKAAEFFNLDYSVPKTMSKISGMSRGWANHYKFCNDVETIRNVDRSIARVFTDYSQQAMRIADGHFEKNNVDLGSALLGYVGSKGVAFTPLPMFRADLGSGDRSTPLDPTGQ